MAGSRSKGTAKKTTSRSRSEGAARTKSVAAGRSKRKAPTQTPAVSKPSSSQLKIAVAVFVALLAVGGISVLIGTSDDGRIDVASTISQRASEQEAAGDTEGGERTRAVSAPQPERTQENSGLIGRGNKETEQQRREAAEQQAVEGAATTSATSSEETGTSTEDSADDAEDAMTEDESGEANEGEATTTPTAE